MCAAQPYIDRNRDHADHRPESEHAEVEMASQYALRERGNQRRLGRCQRIRPCTGGARESISIVQQAEHWRDNQRSEYDTENQRHLLPPWCRADELTGLEVLQIVEIGRAH